MTDCYCFGVLSQLILEGCLAVFLLAHSQVSLYFIISIHGLLPKQTVTLDFNLRYLKHRTFYGTVRSLQNHLFQP